MRRTVHPLVAAVRRSLPRPAPPDAPAYLKLLARRLTALREAASGGTPDWRLDRRERSVARRFVQRFAESWDDGDENLVRGYLDRWLPPEADAPAAAAAALLQAADALAGAEVRPGTLWFFLWEMESVAAGLAADAAPGP